MKIIKKIIPIGIQVVIEPDKPLEEIGGIALPETSQIETYTGKVIAVGIGRPDYIMTVQVGDEVKFGRFGWTPCDVMADGVMKHYYVMAEKDLHAVLREVEINKTDHNG